MKVPNSYFTTAFSGSARVQRARLRNLFAGERRRGVLPLTLVLLSAVLLGALVSCQPTAPEIPEPISTGEPPFPIIISDDILDNTPPVVRRAAQEQSSPGGEYYENFAAYTGSGEAPVFDEAELLFLREDWTYDQLGVVPDTDPAAIKVYSFGARFHTTTPDRVCLAGSPELTDDGWFTPSYDGCHYLIFEERDGVLTYKTYLMVNDTYPGDALFTDDLLRALRPEDFYRSSPSSAAYCAELIRPQPEIMKLTSFTQAAQFDDIVPDGGRVEVWYLAWRQYTPAAADDVYTSANYYTYCFFFMDKDGAILHARAERVSGDELLTDAQALWAAFDAL